MATMLDRLRPAGRDLTRDVTRSLARTGEVVSDRTDELTSAAADAVDLLADRAADSAAEMRDRVTAVAADLDATLRAAKDTVSKGASLDDVTRQLERRWPGTDTGRYDRAFERGYARGRSGRLAVGLVIGAGAAAVGAYLFDPERGVARREALARQLRRLSESAKRAVEERQRAMADRSMAPPAAWSSTEAGVAVGPGIGSTVDDAWATGATGATEDEPEPDLRTPVTAGTVASKGHEPERGDWHRDVPTA